MGSVRAEKRQHTRIVKTVQEDIHARSKRIHSRAQFFNAKQEDGETLDEYWRRLSDIERTCKFNRVTPQEIITDKFEATINDKKARYNFIKSPLELRTVLETIELDKYNRKNRD